MDTTTAVGPVVRPVLRSVVLVDVEDLHPADADRLLADVLDLGPSTGCEPTRVVAEMVRDLGSGALAAHVLRPGAADLLA